MVGSWGMGCCLAIFWKYKVGFLMIILLQCFQAFAIVAVHFALCGGLAVGRLYKGVNGDRAAVESWQGACTGYMCAHVNTCSWG